MLRAVLYLIALSLLTALSLTSCKSARSTASSQKLLKTDESLTEMRFGFLYIEGCTDRMKGNLQDALKKFEECREIYPTNAAVRYELGMVNKMLGSNEAALKHAKAAAEAEPQNPWYQLLLIDCLHNTNNYSQSVKVRESLVKAFPERADFKEDLAIEYAVTGQYDKSFQIYDELERTFGISEQLTLNKAKLLKNRKKYGDAESELKKLIESDPSEPRYYGHLAELYEEINEPEKAKAMYEKILALDPGNPTVNLALHDYYSGKGDQKTAYDYLKKAFLNPDLDIQTKAGIVYTFIKRTESGDREGAAQGAELASLMSATHPEASEGYALQGDFHTLSGNKEEATADYWRAATREKKDYRIWENLQITEYDLGRYDSLLKHSELAIELFPTQARFYLFNGLAASQLRDYKKASHTLQEGVQYAAGDKNLLFEFYRSIGDACYSTGEYDKSDGAFDEALKIDPDNSYVLNNYAYYLSVRGEKLEQAEKMSAQSLKLRPNERSFMDTYGWVLYRQKKYAQAVEWLGKASAMGSPSAVILEHYGDALIHMNRVTEAVAQWEAAKKVGGDQEKLNRKIREKKSDDQ